MVLDESLSRRRLLTLLIAASMTCVSTQAFSRDIDGGGSSGGDTGGGDTGGGDTGGGDTDGGGGGGGDTDGGGGGGGDTGDLGNFDDWDFGDFDPIGDGSVVGSGVDDGDDDSSGRSGRRGKTQDDARDALRRGEVIPLSAAIDSLLTQFDGRIIDVRLTERSSRIDYRFKVVRPDGKVVSVMMNARNGRMRGFFGF